MENGTLKQMSTLFPSLYYTGKWMTPTLLSKGYKKPAYKHYCILKITIYKFAFA